MPDLRPFRALRYDPGLVGDLGSVVAPPYDVIDAGMRKTLLDRHPQNAVRLDLPSPEPGDEPEDRYRRVARLIAAWRSDGALRKDARPSLYVLEQAYRVPGTAIERTQRGFFARLRLEPFGPGGGVLPHERTLSGPKEDRYRLLRATGVNTSPVVMLYDDASGVAAGRVAEVTAGAPLIDVRDEDGGRHRVWAIADDGDAEGLVATVIRAASREPLTIADGHHRYETALRYRDERRMTRSCEPDPPFDFTLALLLDARDALTVLPTHRVLRGLGESGVAALRGRLDGLFMIESIAPDALVERFAGAAGQAGGKGHLGLVTRDGAWLLAARSHAFAPLLPTGGAALRSLDVALLQAALGVLAGIDATSVALGNRVGYTKSAAEAAALVAAGTDGADAAFLLEPTPVEAILAVAREGDVMPQKSTYFYPKALTGLVLNPHEW